MLQLFTGKYLVFTLLFAVLLSGLGCNSTKQSAANLSAEEMQYRGVISSRAAKIVAGLGITDSAKFYKVKDVIAMQYRDLRDIDAAKDAQVKAIKEKYAGNSNEAESQVKNAERAAAVKVTKLHNDYLARLNKHLNAEQIDKVKDGMTYGVLPITYKAYLDMLPSLKDEEKKYIHSALLEAREKAMDGGSSDEKHGIFGKYKGRINNYLSARGYDLTAERKAWNERIDAAKKRN